MQITYFAGKFYGSSKRYVLPAFKICLVSSEKETRYRDYYLFLEECIHYYATLGKLTQWSILDEMRDEIEITDNYAVEQKKDL